MLQRGFLLIGMALFSGALQATLFPPLGWSWLAFAALVPWFVSLERLGAKQAFGLSWLVGLTFFTLSLYWLHPVTRVGLLILAAILALFFAVFGWGLQRLYRSRLSGLSVGLCAAALWVLLEWVRSWLFTGFGWNFLSASQTPFPPALQIAAFTGAWSISFLIVWTNCALGGWVAPRLRFGKGGYALLAGALLLWLGSGVVGLLAPTPTGDRLEVALIQPNIPQNKKWDPEYRPEIVRQFSQLTMQAAQTGPDIILWPETSIPGFYGIDPSLTRWIQSLARQSGTYVLAGSPVMSANDEDLLNRSLLFDPDGVLNGLYDKIHLVPFGEFVPFDRFFPQLRDWLPPIGTFTPGDTATVFRFRPERSAADPQAPLQRFSTLICFEDVFPNLVRRFVNNGAQWLVVMTNDAWYTDPGAYQHLQSSILRAVETRRPVVRAANTGWTGCINRFGVVQSHFEDAAGEALWSQGFLSCEIRPSDERTLYARFGDWFVGLCGLLLAGLAFRKQRKTPSTHNP